MKEKFYLHYTPDGYIISMMKNRLKMSRRIFVLGKDVVVCVIVWRE